MRESEVLHKCMLRLTEIGCRVFRNQVGQYALRDGRFLRSGLCVGSSDLIGWTPCGRFLAVETKSPGGRVTVEQQRFIDAVNQAGGLGMAVWSADDAVARVLRFSHQKGNIRMGLDHTDGWW